MRPRELEALSELLACSAENALYFVEDVTSRVPGARARDVIRALRDLPEGQRSLRQIIDRLRLGGASIGKAPALARPGPRALTASAGGEHPFRAEALAFSPRYGFGHVVETSPQLVRVLFTTRSAPVGFPMPGAWHARDLLPAESSLQRPEVSQERPRESPPPMTSLGAMIKGLHDEVLEELGHQRSPERYLFHRHSPAQPAEGGGPNPALDEALRRGLARIGVGSFFTHQLQAFEALRRGRHALLCTPTASGKTYAYTPFLFQTLLDDPGARALLLFPLVALGEDQQSKLRALNAELPPARRLRLGIYTGALDEAERREVLRGEPQILVTTPDSLHRTFLRNNYANWHRFFRSLRCVVLDEAHLYKGAFGTHVSAILRRLRARCAAAGARAAPRFVVASATIDNPRELASRLTGLAASRFELIDRSGAPLPARHHLSLPGSAVEVCHRLAGVEVEDGGTTRRPKTIIFCRSIRRVHDLSGELRRRFEAEGRGEEAERVSLYYSRARSPRELLSQMESVDFLFTTTALMAGIDLGELDVCLVEGFPGLLMDLRQMFGRAGRRREGASLFVGRLSSVYDEHYLQRPEELFFGAPERAVVNPENPLLLAAHLRCAAHLGRSAWDQEGPLTERQAALFGPGAAAVIEELIGAGELHRAGDRLVHLGSTPHRRGALEDLRGAGEAELEVVDEEGTRLLHRSPLYAYRDFHPRAIVEHDGRLFTVDDLDLSARRVRVRRVRDDRLRTQGQVEVKIARRGPASAEGQKEALERRELGELRVNQAVRKYALQRLETRRVCRGCGHSSSALDRPFCPRCGQVARLVEERRLVEMRPILGGDDAPLDLTLTLDTVGLTMSPTAELVARLDRELRPRPTERAPGEAGDDLTRQLQIALATLADGLQKSVPERLLCDPGDLDAQVLPEGPLGPAPHLYLFDNYPGGLGIAAEVFDQWPRMLAAALARVEGCTCDQDGGCPVCVVSFGARRGARGDRSKLALRYLLRSLLGQPRAPVLEDLRARFGPR